MLLLMFSKNPQNKYGDHCRKKFAHLWIDKKLIPEHFLIILQFQLVSPQIGGRLAFHRQHCWSLPDIGFHLDLHNSDLDFSWPQVFFFHRRSCPVVNFNNIFARLFYKSIFINENLKLLWKRRFFFQFFAAWIINTGCKVSSHRSLHSSRINNFHHRWTFSWFLESS
jgi:hypothetical protein